ncbi:hypothetical protein F0562_035394 [Nyssa sinensis]|uniref:Cellulose synthase-like protein G2 n=1 Tax=Nyssa sinensis TaxID=561372 RepID=A0A5J5AE74_9ASTE|nr:hypothetical protein F0562_035394 [Nyssa sinensis]
MWRPVSRTVFPERLPEDKELPAIDVFVCTADPNNEPTLQVMNTVISAMALDYPPEKVYVYLSDDGGCSVTLQALTEAWGFAKWWLPFCKTYGIKTGCPEAYFSALEDDHDDFRGREFNEERQKILEKYEEFKDSVTRIKENGRVGGKSISINRDHSPVIEVIKHDNTINTVTSDHPKLPLLVYVSREKRISHPHHFKAGALNVLLRVSGIISNSPYILALDCDMYCNGKSSARQAMCFHLDPNISPSLAFVQFPQKFQNISKKDIYDSQWRSGYPIWQGLDGLEGPILSGTGFYIKRKTFYGSSPQKDIDIKELKQTFGSSNEFVKSVNPKYRPDIINGEECSKVFQQEAQFLASCTYEKHTKWGEEVGFLYCLVEDYLTGFTLKCKGWTAVFCNPSRPQFLGSPATNLNDILVQSTRWNLGLLDVAFSKFCPLIYGPLRNMSLLGSMCYAGLGFMPLYCLPVWGLATIPQLCLLNGIPLYPEVSNSFFIVVVFIFLSALLKHLQEILLTGGSMQSLWYEQRIWMIKSVTCHLYGTLDAVMQKIGMKEGSFTITNKVDDDEQVQQYQMGKYDFRTSTMFLVPLVTLVILNVFSLVVGVSRVIISGSFNEMFVQVFLSFYVVAMSYPVMEGMILRKDKGRIPPSVTLLSAGFTLIFLSLGSIVFV